MKKPLSYFILAMILKWAIKKGYEFLYDSKKIVVSESGRTILTLEHNDVLFVASISKSNLKEDAKIKQGLRLLYDEQELNTYGAVTERQLRNMMEELIHHMDNKSWEDNDIFRQSE